MHGCIKFSNGKVLWFNDSNFPEIISGLTEKQKDQLADILINRLGPKPDNGFGVSQEVHSVWHESVHRNDIHLGGGSKNGESNINKRGTKKMVREWKDKGDHERNLTLLMTLGFKRKWDKRIGYSYKKYGGIEVPIEWIQELDHGTFKLKVKGLLDNDIQ